MTRFAMIGGGWRAEFFARIAQALPERFQLTGTYLRDPQKRAAWQARFGGRMAASIPELMEDKPDYLVLSIARHQNFATLMQLMDLNIPILCETIPAETVEDMTTLYKAAQEKGALIQVAEQYMDWPMYQAWMKAVKDGLLGEVTNFSLSAVHSYHAASMIRAFLGVGFENMTIIGKRHQFPIRQTDSRDGMVREGEIKMASRDRFTIEFDSGKTAFMDFDGTQYHSFIRTRQFNLQGTQGEIDDLTIRRMSADNMPLCQNLIRHDRGWNNNNFLCIMGLQLGDKWLWENPYQSARLNDDELAIALLMDRMGALSRGESDTPAYSLEDGLQDAYFHVLMNQAAANPWQPIRSETQIWGDFVPLFRPS